MRANAVTISQRSAIKFVILLAAISFFAVVVFESDGWELTFELVGNFKRAYGLASM